jgi:hypothetical protein
MALRREEIRAADAAVYVFPTAVARSRARRAAMLARRRRSAAVAAILILASSGAWTLGRGGGVASRAGAPARVTVRTGDTLWDLAARYAHPDTDARAYVDALAASNGLHGELLAGVRLELPE